MAKMTRLQAARALLKKKPNISPSEAAAQLKKRGYRDATPGYVSSLKTNIKYEKDGNQVATKTVSKMDKMREIFRKTPDAHPPTVAEKFGASPTQAYKARKDCAGPPRAGSPGPRAYGRMPDKVSLKAIAGAKTLIDDLGGLDKASAAIDVIEELGGTRHARATLEAIAVLTA